MRTACQQRRQCREQPLCQPNLPEAAGRQSWASGPTAREGMCWCLEWGLPVTSSLPALTVLPAGQPGQAGTGSGPPACPPRSSSLPETRRSRAWDGGADGGKSPQMWPLPSHEHWHGLGGIPQANFQGFLSPGSQGGPWGSPGRTSQEDGTDTPGVLVLPLHLDAGLEAAVLALDAGKDLCQW